MLIPVHIHWAITLNALLSMVAMVNGTRFEVIVADDASSDAAQQLGRQLPWLRIWRSEVNQGFWKSATAEPSLMNSGFNTTSNGMATPRACCSAEMVVAT